MKPKRNKSIQENEQEFMQRVMKEFMETFKLTKGDISKPKTQEHHFIRMNLLAALFDVVKDHKKVSRFCGVSFELSVEAHDYYRTERVEVKKRVQEIVVVPKPNLVSDEGGNYVFLMPNKKLAQAKFTEAYSKRKIEGGYTIESIIYTSEEGIDVAVGIVTFVVYVERDGDKINETVLINPDGFEIF